MEIIKDLAIKGSLGAACGFVATKCLALGGVVVSNPAMGALYGATLFLVPKLEDMGVKMDTNSRIKAIALFALEFFIGVAAGMAVTALCGFNLTLANAAILSVSTTGVVLTSMLALYALGKALKSAPAHQA